MVSARREMGSPSRRTTRGAEVSAGAVLAARTKRRTKAGASISRSAANAVMPMLRAGRSGVPTVSVRTRASPARAGVRLSRSPPSVMSSARGEAAGASSSASRSPRVVSARTRSSAARGSPGWSVGPIASIMLRMVPASRAGGPTTTGSVANAMTVTSGGAALSAIASMRSRARAFAASSLVPGPSPLGAFMDAERSMSRKTRPAPLEASSIAGRPMAISSASRMSACRISSQLGRIQRKGTLTSRSFCAWSHSMVEVTRIGLRRSLSR